MRFDPTDAMTSGEVQNVEFHEYPGDDGIVMAETVITLEDCELVVVEDSHSGTHKVYERKIGDTEPYTQWKADGPEGVPQI